MKLRAKYLGPFRVIKAYTSSLIVVPWTEISRLDEYYRDPNIFRLIHRGDIRPFIPVRSQLNTVNLSRER